MIRALLLVLMLLPATALAQSTDDHYCIEASLFTEAACQIGSPDAEDFAIDDQRE